METNGKNNSDKKLITKKDKIIMTIITLIYAVFSFINLGSFTNPQTFWKSEYYNDTVILELEKESKISYIRYFTGNTTDKYYISFSNDKINYSDIYEVNPEYAYHWYDFNFNSNVDYKYIKIVSASENLYLGELGVFDADKNLINTYAVSENSKVLVDEQNTIPDEITYMNSSYFDEIYFPRTAYEYLHNLPIYEWTHPPLGKLIMAVPISILGMTPFAYRLLGNVAGIIMIPLMYILAKMLFKKTICGVTAALIMAFDGMHFVQTRIGTVDSFLVMFIILEYIFMYKYILSKDKPLKSRLWALFWCGLFMGCSLAIKWSGAFSAIGLAFIFFIDLIIEIAKNKKWTKQNTITILSCIVFFIIIPIIIYLLSFIPLALEDPSIASVSGFLNWQEKMYDYHHDLQAIHAYSSEWYTWPITQKSVFYWTGTLSDGTYSKIALLGNPVIFWFSIPCMLFVLIRGIYDCKFNDWLIIIAILSAMIPYTGISRVMFLYHYFPTLPFAMLSIVAFLSWLCEKIKNNVPIYLFLTLALIIFIKFYPIYSGLPVSFEYLENLKWLKTWKW